MIKKPGNKIAAIIENRSIITAVNSCTTTLLFLKRVKLIAEYIKSGNFREKLITNTEKNC